MSKIEVSTISQVTGRSCPCPSLGSLLPCRIPHPSSQNLASPAVSFPNMAPSSKFCIQHERRQAPPRPARHAGNARPTRQRLTRPSARHAHCLRLRPLRYRKASDHHSQSLHMHPPSPQPRRHSHNVHPQSLHLPVACPRNVHSRRSHRRSLKLQDHRPERATRHMATASKPSAPPSLVPLSCSKPSCSASPCAPSSSRRPSHPTSATSSSPR